MQTSPRKFSKSADKSVDTELRLGLWETFDDYQIVHGRTGREAGRAYIKADIREDGRVYRPLVDTPGLFLEFSMLADEPGLDSERNAEVYLDWCDTYGTLGLEQVEQRGRHGVSTRGGPEDSLENFVGEAWIANHARRLYDAGTAEEPDMDIIRSHARKYYHPVRAAFYTEPHPAPRYPEKKEPHAVSLNRAREFAMREVVSAVQEKVARSVYPALYQRKDGTFEQGWDFTNLLGAMWLQMLWLVTDPEKARRCSLPGCNAIVYRDKREELPEDLGLKKNVRKSYKTRTDKLFCSEKHRKKYHYLTVVKPRRQAEKARQTDTS